FHVVLFFFSSRRRHTRSKRDWSSDVCSSDLGALRMVSTGGLIPRKDPLIAVEVLAQLVERGVDAHLEWLGEGPLRQDTSALAAQLQVSDRLSLPGSVDGAGVR